MQTNEKKEGEKGVETEDKKKPSRIELWWEGRVRKIVAQFRKKEERAEGSLTPSSVWIVPSSPLLPLFVLLKSSSRMLLLSVLPLCVLYGSPFFCDRREGGREGGRRVNIVSLILSSAFSACLTFRSPPPAASLTERVPRYTSQGEQGRRGKGGGRAKKKLSSRNPREISFSYIDGVPQINVERLEKGTPIEAGSHFLLSVAYRYLWLRHPVS